MWTKEAGSVGVSAFALSGCGGGGGTQSSQASSTPSQPANVNQPSISASQRAAARVALHASFSASQETIAAIEKDGIDAWLEKSVNAKNKSSALKFFEERGYDVVDDNRYWAQRYYFDHMIWSEFLSGGNTVRKRMAFALSQIFVVSVNDLDTIWPAQAVGHYWDLLNENAFSNFRQLLEAVTLSPAMGTFLDTRGNQKSNVSTGRVPDENFARELMQLFSIGLFELNLDGSIKSQNGQPIETYNNDDVTGLAKVFTGYDHDYSAAQFFEDTRQAGRFVPDASVVRLPLTADPNRWNPKGVQSLHETSEKSFLGCSIPGGIGPEESLKLALDWICDHPNVAPFISKQLIQRLVTSNPSPAYVQRVAGVFNNNGKGIKGDLKAVFKAIILDDEANDIQGLASNSFGKLREPALRFAQWGQTFHASSSNGTWEIRNLAEPGLLNQVPFRSPSVFNFFRPAYARPNSEAAEQGLVAPEFQISTETSVAGYFNFIRATIEANNFWTDNISASYEAEIEIGDNPQLLLDHLDLILTAGQLSEATRDLALAAIQSVPIDAADENSSLQKRVWIGIALIMLSNDYLIQR